MPGRKYPLEFLAEVRRRVLAFEPHEKIVRECAALFGRTPRQVAKYLAYVIRDMGRTHDGFTPQAKAVRRNQGERLLEMAIEAGDLRAGIRALHLLCQVDGCYEPEKMVVTSDVEQRFGAMTTEERRARILELLPKVFPSDVTGAN